MDFNRLDSTEKLAVYGSIAVIVGGLLGAGIGGIAILAVLAAVGMLAVVFLPQFSPSTTLPGSKGSLMLILGGIAAVAMLLALLQIAGLLGVYFQVATLSAIFFLVAVIGAFVMGWAGWQAFQAEGGKFVLGGSGASGTSGAGPSTRTFTSRADEPAPLDRAAHDATATEPRMDDAGEDRPATPRA